MPFYSLQQTGQQFWLIVALSGNTELIFGNQNLLGEKIASNFACAVL